MRRNFYLTNLGPDERLVVVSAPRQDQSIKGDKAYGSEIGQVPAEMTITSVTEV